MLPARRLLIPYRRVLPRLILPPHHSLPTRTCRSMLAGTTISVASDLPGCSESGPVARNLLRACFGGNTEHAEQTIGLVQEFPAMCQTVCPTTDSGSQCDNVVLVRKSIQIVCDPEEHGGLYGVVRTDQVRI